MSLLLLEYLKKPGNLELLPSSLTENSSRDEISDLYTETRTAPITWHPCTAEEVRDAIFHTGNTSSGPGEISPFIIKKAWPIYKNEITLLFHMCLEEGYPSVNLFKRYIMRIAKAR